MRLALSQARMAAQRGEVPVGAVVTRGDRLVASAHNLREVDRDPTAHAELLAIIRASQVLGRWRLSGCTLYVTLEPCPMCAGAIVNARLDRVVYGATDPKAGAVRSLFTIADDPRLNHRASLTAGILEDDCSAILKNFFRARRKAAKNPCKPSVEDL